MLELNIRRSADNSLVPVNIASLAIQVSGDVRFPAEEGGRSVNGNCPAVVIRCATVDDALQCLDFATRKGLLISMHNRQADPADWSDCDQGIAVDLGGLAPPAAMMGSHSTHSAQHLESMATG